MSANVVLLFTLVWTFTAICQAFDDGFFSVSCDDVTGSVGKEVTLTCRVSLQRNDCCVAIYMFQYPEIYNDSAICTQELPEDPCEQRSIFTCNYTPTTAMTEKFIFSLQTECGMKRTKFTVNIIDSCDVSCANVTGSVGKEVTLTCSVPQLCFECCITHYMFKYPNYDSTICRQALPEDSCEQGDSFTCSYTPTTAKTEIMFVMQTKCGRKNTKFTVDTTDTIKHLIATEPPGHGSKALVLTGVSGFIVIIIIIIIIIVVAIICVKRFKSTNPSGFQMNYERGVYGEQEMVDT
ncbi:uncharacterized protein LOC113056516 [Carassius auratus]|uniref:Uncharacterized protein LOC113056516 n=1 Tax=Carassius auratus TaxID=7957 RepID=A0A6P6L5Z9_CARAU|nr:uncharacterized protein LOC113056516 [Carassius auratus]XP_026079083.1 uncharacterized protein LOC113056516 [Carassius auratus]